MSKRARSRPDKRATALGLASLCGHGAPMPAEPPVDDRDEDDVLRDDYGYPIDPPRDRPSIGPLDCGSAHQL